MLFRSPKIDSQLEIKIDGQSFEVKKIGVRLVHRQDIEDLGVLHHDLNDSASESIRNQQSNDEEGGPGLSLVENATILRNHRQRGSKTRGING